jgi:hypothetical protein
MNTTTDFTVNGGGSELSSSIPLGIGGVVAIVILGYFIRNTVRNCRSGVFRSQRRPSNASRLPNWTPFGGIQSVRLQQLPQTTFQNEKMLCTWRGRRAQPKSESSDPPACSICLQPYIPGSNLRMLPCRHCFHRCCIDSWLTHHINCPLCRTSVYDDTLPLPPPPPANTDDTTETETAASTDTVAVNMEHVEMPEKSGAREDNIQKEEAADL